MSRRLYLLPLLGLASLLTACGEPAIDTYEYPVESLAFFGQADDIDTHTAHIETDTEVLVPSNAHLYFVTTDNPDMTVTLEKRNRVTLGQAIFGYSPKYTLYIPEDHLKDISQDYANVFQDTLLHTPESEMEE